MAGVEWVAAGVSVVGAGLSYLGARRGSQPELQAVKQSERDEWGRRFATGIELMTAAEPRQRAMGRALVDALLDSDLAQPDDRRIARALLTATVLGMTQAPVARATAHAVPADVLPTADERADSARLLIKLAGGPEHVDPAIVHAAGAPRES